MNDTVPNVLASRYASPEIKAIWSEDGRILLEREFWIAVMKAQRRVGISIPDEAIVAYERVKENIDLESIRLREEQTRHDVKARIEEFCHLARSEHIHKGLTSRDLTDNVEQFQIIRSLQHLRTKYVRLLTQLSERSEQWIDVAIVGRTHHAAAQPTTLGKRLAMFGEEMLQAFGQLDHFIQTYPMRGLKGAVGTSLDQLTLVEGNAELLARLQEEICCHLGTEVELGAIGQIYPRSLDFALVSTLYQLGAGIANLARTWRLMAGAEAATEGFVAGQVGSSAMPHKMNSRSSERINGLQVVVGGYVHMLGALAGDQWFEGDVSCSVVRRVAIPDAFFAFDGMVETALHVIDDMGVYEAVIDAELQRFLPFLATTTLLMTAVKRGCGREVAHDVMRQHAVAAALKMRRDGLQESDLVQRLANDKRLPIDAAEIRSILAETGRSSGLARDQVVSFVQNVRALCARFPDAADVRKNPML